MIKGDSTTPSYSRLDTTSYLGDDMTKWRQGLAPLPDNDKLAEVFTLLWALQYSKEKTYGSSWKGKGEYRGIMSNIDRKYDRIDKITTDELNKSREPLTTKPYAALNDKDLAQIGESKIDAVADLANYCLLYLTYLKDRYPGAFEFWVRSNIPEGFRTKIPFI